MTQNWKHLDFGDFVETKKRLFWLPLYNSLYIYINGKYNWHYRLWKYSLVAGLSYTVHLTNCVVG